MDNRNDGGSKLKPRIKMSCKIAATMIIIYCMIGSIASMAQEGQIIKEIKITTTVKNKDVPYKYDNSILLYTGNVIKLHCIVNPTLNYSIKKAYLNITRKDGGIDPISFPLGIKHNEKGDYIDEPIDWTLTEEFKDYDGIYLAKIDLITTNVSIPDAGAYVSMKMSFSGVPTIIKFEDINSNGVFDKGTDKLLQGWKFIVEDPDGSKNTYVTAEDGTIRLDPVAVGERYSQIKEQETKNWVSQQPQEMEDGGYTVQKEERGDENVLYFANHLKPAALQLVKYEDRNNNGRYDPGEGLPGRSFKVTGPGFTDVVVTNETGVAAVDGIPFWSVTGLPDDRPMQRYNITEGPMAGWRALSPIIVELFPGENRIKYVENVLLSGKINVRKYEDINGNNRYDPDEGCPGWTITVKGPGIDQTKDTDENGVASFDIGFKTEPGRPNELPKNQYIIHENPKDNWENVKDQSITLGPYEEKTVDIENTPLPGIIVVHKFEDKDDNGEADTGEEGKGWTFNVQGKGVRNPTATTNESGIATFIVDFKSDAGNPCQPQAQEFTIHEVPKNCYEIQPDQQVELSPGNRQDRTFINRIPPVTLVIQKFYDANKNAVLDPGEDDGKKYPLSDWQYEIAYQGNVESRTTDRDGTTSITLPVSVPESICTVREVTDRPGWICTTTNPRQIKVTCENPTLRTEFGNKPDKIIIKKFNDLNMNGKQDEGEDGLPGWTFSILGPNGNPITAGPTNNDGMTTKEGLQPGSYIVREVPQDGWINTTSLSVPVDVRAGEDAPMLAFGNIKSSRIELFKFNDTDKNGKLDSYESGLPGWTFTVRYPNGDVVITRPTDENGITSLERLTPGVYTITENLVEGWINTTPLTKRISLSIGDEKKASFGNYYCLPCHRFENRMPPTSTDGDVIVSKKVSNLSTENINRVSGNDVNYNITICPSRPIDKIASIPTDIVIAVDNSPSIVNFRESAVDGVRKLADDIAANDKSHVTRIGLVSWSDENNSGVEVPLIDNYTEVDEKASKITFAEGNYTKFNIALDKSIKAFDKASEGKEKKIVIITDASDNGYVEPRFTNVDLSGYSIFAIVVGEKNETKALAMLNDLTSKHKGYIIPITDLSELGEALVKTATAGSIMKNVHLVEVLPNYLALNNSTATDDGGKVTLNGDSKDWTTTTITWDIGDLFNCWSTDFQAVFCWKLPADANQPQRNSYVNYTDENGARRTLSLPEHEINILPGAKSEPVVTTTSAAKPEKEAPGFQALFAVVGLSLAGYLYRRREN